MNLIKGATKVVSQETAYTGESDNFEYNITAITGNGQVTQTNGTAKRKIADSAQPDANVGTFGKWGQGQLNIQFNVSLTTEEQIELVTAYNEIVESINASAE